MECEFFISSSSSGSSISSLSDSFSSSESSSSSDSSSSRATSSLSSQSVQLYQSNALEGESAKQSNALEAEATSPTDVRSVSVDVARLLADIGSINRYCEDMTAQIANDILATTSTPTIESGMRRRLDVTPVEVIDLSNLDRPATNRAPDAVIDLCSPDRPQLVRPTALGRRRHSPDSTSDAANEDDPSPPKYAFWKRQVVVDGSN